MAQIYVANPCSISSATPVSVAGFPATSISKTILNVLVESFDESGNHIGHYQIIFVNPRNGPTFIDLCREGNFEGLYKLKITLSCGTNAGMSASSTHLAIGSMQVYWIDYIQVKKEIE